MSLADLVDSLRPRSVAVDAGIAGALAAAATVDAATVYALGALTIRAVVVIAELYARHRQPPACPRCAERSDEKAHGREA